MCVPWAAGGATHLLKPVGFCGVWCHPRHPLPPHPISSLPAGGQCRACAVGSSGGAGAGCRLPENFLVNSTSLLVTTSTLLFQHCLPSFLHLRTLHIS